MNEVQAYKAMVRFLEKYYERTNSDDVGSLLSDMIMLVDGRTADPAAWEDWLVSIREINTKVT